MLVEGLAEKFVVGREVRGQREMEYRSSCQRVDPMYHPVDEEHVGSRRKPVLDSRSLQSSTLS